MSILLLLLHLTCLAIFCVRWLNATKAATGKRIFLFTSSSLPASEKELSPAYITLTMFVSNFIGICFARTLHYQFYSWYFHALPFLLWCNTISPQSNKIRAPHHILLRIIQIVAIEFAFLTFPATPTSSAILQITHMCILFQIRVTNVLLLPATNASEDQNMTMQRKIN